VPDVTLSFIQPVMVTGSCR